MKRVESGFTWMNLVRGLQSLNNNAFIGIGIGIDIGLLFLIHDDEFLAP